MIDFVCGIAAGIAFIMFIRLIGYITSERLHDDGIYHIILWEGSIHYELRILKPGTIPGCNVEENFSINTCANACKYYLQHKFRRAFGDNEVMRINTNEFTQNEIIEAMRASTMYEITQ